MNIELNGLNVNYIKEGSGDENVLILEGWGTKISTYNVLINAVSQYSTVYCFDMPGFGETSEPNQSLNLDDYVDLVINFITSMKIKKLSLIGHSNGGRVIIKMMARKNLPFDINKIVIIGGAGLVHEKTFSQKCKIAYFKFGKKILNFKPIKLLFPKALDNFKNKFGSADYKSATPIMRETMVKLINEDVKEYLPSVNAPTILIYGENDTATPPSDGEYISKVIPDAGFIKVKNASHYVFLENPGYINLIIKTFLTSK